MLCPCCVRVLVFMLRTCACVHVAYVCLCSCCVRVLVFMLRTCACVHVAYVCLCSCCVRALVFMLRTCACVHVVRLRTRQGRQIVFLLTSSLATVVGWQWCLYNTLTIKPLYFHKINNEEDIYYTDTKNRAIISAFCVVGNCPPPVILTQKRARNVPYQP